ncbi:MAG: TIGR04282 family arsenosugar biosynthesis glycosyltransferase [Magnetococcales bacterium]|nr:TIGR04282 family arsenosugar biosynthesis glycosyltransferase [Magnetococcales bacterium]
MKLVVQLMGKAPLPGYAKTRLIPALGPDGAAAAQRRLMTRLCSIVGAWVAASPRRSWRLWADPDLTHPCWRELAPAEHLRVQPPGDLGARMSFIAREGLKEADAVFLLGTDTASTDFQLLDDAESALAQGRAVLAPAEDGGYTLLGLRRWHPALFHEISWGGATVAEQTRSRFHALGWPWWESQPQWDVDDAASWFRFVSEM